MVDVESFFIQLRSSSYDMETPNFQRHVADETENFSSNQSQSPNTAPPFPPPFQFTFTNSSQPHVHQSPPPETTISSQPATSRALSPTDSSLPDPTPRSLQRQIQDIDLRLHRFEVPEEPRQSETAVMKWLQEADLPALSRVKWFIMQRESDLDRDRLASEFATHVLYYLHRETSGHSKEDFDRMKKLLEKIRDTIGSPTRSRSPSPPEASFGPEAPADQYDLVKLSAGVVSILIVSIVSVLEGQFWILPNGITFCMLGFYFANPGPDDQFMALVRRFVTRMGEILSITPREQVPVGNEARSGYQEHQGPDEGSKNDEVQVDGPIPEVEDLTDGEVSHEDSEQQKHDESMLKPGVCGRTHKNDDNLGTPVNDKLSKKQKRRKRKQMQREKNKDMDLGFAPINKCVRKASSIDS